MGFAQPAEDRADTHDICVFTPFPRLCGKGFFIFLRAASQLMEVNTFAK